MQSLSRRDQLLFPHSRWKQRFFYRKSFVFKRLALPQSLHDNSTKGIDVQQTNLPGIIPTKTRRIPIVPISGVADVSLWEFSGQECYYGLYDHFIGNTNCIHLVLYSLADPLEVQLQQASSYYDENRASKV